MTDRPSNGPTLANGDGRPQRTRQRVAVDAGTDDAERIAGMVPDARERTIRPPAAAADVAVWIVDEHRFTRRRATFARVRESGGRILLVAADPELPAERWERIDDVVTRPLQQPAVQRRIEQLIALGPPGDRRANAQIDIDCLSRPTVTARLEDGRRVVEAVNDAFADVFGYDPGAVVGTPLEDWTVPPDARESARKLVRRAARGEVVERVVRRETVTGRRDLRVRMVACPRRGAPDVYVSYDDVTADRCRAQQVRVLNRVLRHNLRNGMNVIVGNADLLVDRVDDDGAVDAARAIRDASRDLVELGETASRLQRPGDGETRQLLDAVDVVDRVRMELQRSSPDAQIRVRAPDTCPVIADARLETAVKELCENALRYASDGDRPVTVAVAREDGWTSISVCDEGPGLPSTERAVLRGDEETPLKHGSGLGLWIVNWIVSGLGGEIGVADNQPTGTEVTLSLPSTPRRPDRPPCRTDR